MELFETKKVFSNKLYGKAVRIEGYDSDGAKWDGIYLVKDTRFDHIVVTGLSGNEYELYMDEFETGAILTLKILEEK